MKKFLIFLAVLLFTSISIYVYSATFALTNIQVVNTTIKSSKIPTNMDGVKILFFADIKYGEFMDQNRLMTVIDKINNVGGDIIIFGGDIISENAKIDDSDIRILTQLLTKIDAPLGKFAILGDVDEKETNKTTIKKILYDSSFEVLNNQIISLHNGSNASINLIALANSLNGNNEYNKVLAKLNNQQFNFIVSHTPDTMKAPSINIDTINLALCAHSLGRQIDIPFLPIQEEISGAVSYDRGSYDINNMKLIVTNGLGTVNHDLRLFTPPQINVIHLHSVKEKTKKETNKTNKTNKKSDDSKSKQSAK